MPTYHTMNLLQKFKTYITQSVEKRYFFSNVFLDRQRGFGPYSTDLGPTLLCTPPLTLEELCA